MKKIFIIFLFLFLLLGCNLQKKNRNSPETIIDDLGNSFSLSTQPEKVVSLAPNLTEIIFFVGGEKYLKGVTTYCDFPPQAQQIEKIGDLITIDYEKIYKINPDIIFMTVEGNTKAQYEKLKNLGFNVFVSNPRNFKGIEKSILQIGKILDKGQNAKHKIDSLNYVLKNIKGKIKPENDSALFLISVQPLMSANKNTFIGEYLSFFGIKNIAQKSSQSYPVINIETIIKENPSMIILPEKMYSQFEDLVKQTPILKNIGAIKNHKIIKINPDLYFKPGPRFVKALIDLKNKIGKHVADSN